MTVEPRLFALRWAIVARLGEAAWLDSAWTDGGDALRRRGYLRGLAARHPFTDGSRSQLELVQLEPIQLDELAELAAVPA